MTTTKEKPLRCCDHPNGIGRKMYEIFLYVYTTTKGGDTQLII